MSAGGLVLAAALRLVGPAVAPGECNDTVQGRVVDQTTGKPVAEALVRLGQVSVETDATGHFELRGVCPGDHALAVERPDYETVRQRVAVDGDTEVDVHALPRELEHEDHVLVQVSAAPPTEMRAICSAPTWACSIISFSPPSCIAGNICTDRRPPVAASSLAPIRTIASTVG